MNEYYLHDRPEGQSQTAAQIWRDAHTVDQLAAKIRVYLQEQLAKRYGYVDGNELPQLTQARTFSDAPHLEAL